MRSLHHGKRFLHLSLCLSFLGWCYCPSSAEDQRGCAVSGEAETYKAGEEPCTLTVGDTAFSTPYGYDREANDDRYYPLVVIGRWGEGQKYFDDAIQRKYPAFYLIYPYSSEPDGVKLAELIDTAL